MEKRKTGVTVGFIEITEWLNSEIKTKSHRVEVPRGRCDIIDLSRVRCVETSCLRWPRPTTVLIPETSFRHWNLRLRTVNVRHIFLVYRTTTRPNGKTFYPYYHGESDVTLLNYQISPFRRLYHKPYIIREVWESIIISEPRKILYTLKDERLSTNHKRQINNEK